MKHIALFLLPTLFMLGCRAPDPQPEPQAPKKPVERPVVKKEPVVQQPVQAPKPVVRKKQIFLVIDDGGLIKRETQQFVDIPVPMTIAVLPHLKYTKEVCDMINRTSDKEVILHQPMEAYKPELDTGAGAIRNTMHPKEIPGILRSNLASVSGAVGVNNHMGSRVTENQPLMHAVLLHCKKNDLFFLDSKTAYNSQVPAMADALNVHVEQRHVFLDIKHNHQHILKMWNQAVSKADKNGYVIVIGHVWSDETANVIRENYRTLQQQGYTFHKLSELYK